MTTRFRLRPSVTDLTFQLSSRPIHPEFFDILAGRRLRQAGFELDLWITRTGHAITCRGRRTALFEVTAADQPLPESGRLLRHRLRGERCDMLGSLPGLNYQVSFQVEYLTDDQFRKVHGNIVAGGGQRGLVHAFTPHQSGTLTPLSSIEVEGGNGCLSLATLHTFPGELAVVKTQSLIERH